LPKIKHFPTPPIFGLATPLAAWKKILTECAQARQDKLGLQI